jgi:hypothetical protein
MKTGCEANQTLSGAVAKKYQPTIWISTCTSHRLCASSSMYYNSHLKCIHLSYYSNTTCFDPGTATDYGPGRPRGRCSSPGTVKNFLFSTSSRPALGLTQPPIRWVPEALSPGYSDRGVNLTTRLHLMKKSRAAELYLHSCSHLHSMAFNLLRPQATSSLLYVKKKAFGQKAKAVFSLRASNTPSISIHTYTYRGSTHSQAKQSASRSRNAFLVLINKRVYPLPLTWTEAKTTYA